MDQTPACLYCEVCWLPDILSPLSLTFPAPPLPSLQKLALNIGALENIYFINVQWDRRTYAKESGITINYLRWWNEKLDVEIKIKIYLEGLKHVNI